MLRSTILLKYLSNLHRHQNVQIFSYNLIRQLSSKDTGLIKSSEIKFDTDILLQNLRNSMSIENVLNIIEDHHKIMNSKHLLQALRSLFLLQKSKNSNVSTQEILSDPNFHKLCNSLKSQVRSIDLRESVEALKVVSFMGIPSNSRITQILLQLIKQNVNHLSLQQIIFLNYIIKQMKATPLSDAVLMALPIVFEIQMPLKLDKDNVVQLTDCLQFISKTNPSDSTVNILIDALMKHKYIDPKDAIRIVWSLCDLYPQESLAPLLHKALRVVINNDIDLKFSDIETILTKLSHRTNIYQPYYYNEYFFNTVANKTIDENLGLQQAIYIQIKLNKVGHHHRGLLDYIARNYDENVVSSNGGNLLTLINSFALSEYKPRLDWDKFKEYIGNNYHISKSGLESIKYATKLAVLDIYIPKILEYAFRDEHLINIIQNGNLNICKMYLTLYQSVYATQEECKKYLPPYTEILKLIERYVSLNAHDSIHGMPLKNYLEKAYGGKQYILNNCITRNGISIQHAIIMRKGGFPVAFNNTAEQSPIILDELIYPADSKIVAILGLSQSCYCLNNNILKGLYSLTVRTLEASNFSVVVIPIQKLMEFPEHERIPFLTRAIRDKSESMEEIHATV